MKHFVIGLLVIIGIIAVIVIFKRIGGNDNPVPADSGSSTTSDINTGEDEGDTLPQ
jgi:hypothetical protein